MRAQGAADALAATRKAPRQGRRGRVTLSAGVEDLVARREGLLERCRLSAAHAATSDGQAGGEMDAYGPINWAQDGERTRPFGAASGQGQQSRYEVCFTHHRVRGGAKRASVIDQTYVVCRRQRQGKTADKPTSESTAPSGCCSTPHWPKKKASVSSSAIEVPADMSPAARQRISCTSSCIGSAHRGAGQSGATLRSAASTQTSSPNKRLKRPTRHADVVGGACPACSARSEGPVRREAFNGESRAMHEQEPAAEWAR